MGRDRDLGSLLGVMAKSMRDIGGKESSMGLDTLLLKIKRG